MTSPFEIVHEFRKRQEYNDAVLAWLHAELKYQIQSDSLPPLSED